MKPYLLPLIFLLVTSLACRAQSIPATGAAPAAFVPAGYRVLPGGQATGDLNGDSRPDVALALGQAAAGQPEAPRTVLVLWGQAGGGYKRGPAATSAILCATCGGLLGDPFEKLTITKGVLSITHRGGSRERWRLVAKFRYQQSDFYQIGETYDMVDDAGQPCPKLPGNYRAGSERRDENLLTGSFERVSVSADCQLTENKRGRQPVKPLVRLRDYHPQP